MRETTGPRKEIAFTDADIALAYDIGKQREEIVDALEIAYNAHDEAEKDRLLRALFNNEHRDDE